VQGQRGVDINFRWFQLLYQRCVLEDVEGERLLAARINYKEQSVNWSKYSKPWDVIFDDPGSGIVQFFVGGLPRDLPNVIPKGTKSDLYTFRPAHVPLPLVYPHCEIWTFKVNTRIQGKKLGELAKKEYRALMSERSFVICQPSV
jgi:hypothetical protein